MQNAKLYEISKHLVMDAFQRVRSNGGSAGIDGVTIGAYEEHLKGNLYKLWNRMSSGTYFPPAVKLVEIPKSQGGTKVTRSSPFKRFFLFVHVLLKAF